MEQNKDGSNELDTLEDQDTKVTATPEKVEEASKEDAKKKKGGKFSIGKIVNKINSRLNVYLLGFILLTVISLIIIFIVINSSNKEAAKQENIQTQQLTQDAINNLSSNESTVGDPKQLLSIESNAVFSGKVLIRDGLDVAGPIKVGGDLSLPGITVSGKSQFD